jgi:hypothetical protein
MGVVERKLREREELAREAAALLCEKGEPENKDGPWEADGTGRR